LHKSFDGLAGAVQQYLQADPFYGHLFVFFNRTFRLVIILYWDHDSYAIWSKRLAQGHFNIPQSADGKIEVNL
jgi:transposase